MWKQHIYQNHNSWDTYKGFRVVIGEDVSKDQIVDSGEYIDEYPRH